MTQPKVHSNDVIKLVSFDIIISIYLDQLYLINIPMFIRSSSQYDHDYFKEICATDLRLEFRNS